MGIINKDSTEKRIIGKKRRRKPTHGSRSDDLDEETEGFIIQGRFELNSSTDFGDDIQLTLHLKNTSKKSESVNIKLSSSSIEYTGRPNSEIYSDTATLTVPAKKGNPLFFSYLVFRRKHGGMANVSPSPLLTHYFIPICKPDPVVQ